MEHNLIQVWNDNERNFERILNELKRGLQRDENDKDRK